VFAQSECSSSPWLASYPEVMKSQERETRRSWQAGRQGEEWMAGLHVPHVGLGTKQAKHSNCSSIRYKSWILKPLTEPTRSQPEPCWSLLTMHMTLTSRESRRRCLEDSTARKQFKQLEVELGINCLCIAVLVSPVKSPDFIETTDQGFLVWNTAMEYWNWTLEWNPGMEYRNALNFPKDAF